MAYDVWQTCMLVSGVDERDCASWVQAWGSIAAILAAVGIAWWQRHTDRSEAAGIARVRAEVAGTGILLKMNPILGCVRGVEEDVSRASEQEPLHPGHLAYLLSELDYPSDDEILAVADHDHLLARQLVRGRALATQAEAAFSLIERFDPRIRVLDAARRTQLVDLLKLSQDQFEKARARLTDLVPKGAD